MKLPASTLLLLLGVLLVSGGVSFAGGSVLRRTLRQLLCESKDLLKLCASRNHSQWDCLRKESLEIVDQFANSERIPLLAGASLVRVSDAVDTIREDGVDVSLNAAINGSFFVGRYLDQESEIGTRSSQTATNRTWQDHVLKALNRMLQTHVLQVDLLQVASEENRRAKKKKNLWFWRNHEKSAVEGRHRRHRHQMIPMMILGVTVFGMFVIPIGFQFLAALSGKAFLMAKLALLLASINGLKRVASAGVHYGLYHTVDPHHLPHSPAVFYDRESTFGPRNFPPIE
ncbi:uncharacterized protein LOC128746296 [Sabethes cyaneus]|uniref:uncharacterized protein LOC128746296 n=1 Tax=Sabethes cyaneus TaxID=53552 RepID=UPI00237D8095|nr:uncharacterized protein LOC128746296 [Sabethes cyaneus]